MFSFQSDEATWLWINPRDAIWIFRTKENEILQMRILDPALAMLDETDSGLDVDAVRIVADNIRKYHNENNALIMITHLNQSFIPRIRSMC